ncbi:WXG100 family type VII secretion target [Streptomyces sp. NPDC054933]
MTGDVSAKHDDLHTLAGDLENMKGHLQKQISTLYQVIDQVGASWTGGAASAYKGLQHRVNEDLHHLNGVLEMVRELVQGAGRGFANLDEEHRDAFKRLQGNTGDNSIVDALSG